MPRGTAALRAAATCEVRLLRRTRCAALQRRPSAACADAARLAAASGAYSAASGSEYTGSSYSGSSYYSESLAPPLPPPPQPKPARKPLLSWFRRSKAAAEAAAPAPASQDIAAAGEGLARA